MYYLSEVCVLCLNSKQLESVLVLDDDGVAVQQQLSYLLPEITISKSEIPEFICFSCRTTVQSFCRFRKMSLENYSRLMQYTQILNGSSDPRGQKFSKLQIQINKLDLMMERQQDVHSDLNVKEEMEDSLESLEEHDPGTVVDDDIDIKEEFVPNSEDLELYLKHVKDESAADDEEDSVSRSSSEDDNQPDEDEANFSADTDNVNGIRDYKCSVCDKTFVQQSALNRHMKIHSGIRDFKCSVCDKRFARNAYLSNHMKIHSGIRDYKCSNCDKTFVQQSALNRHMKIHSGIRGYKCSVCGKTFVHQRVLSRHKKIHSGIRDHKCSVCDKMFVQKINLAQHMKIHSGI